MNTPHCTIHWVNTECAIYDANDLQSGNSTLGMDRLHCHQGEQSRLQLFRLIVTWWQLQRGQAGVASDAEHQPGLLAHMQPSALISRHVLTIALMCLLSGKALPHPPNKPFFFWVSQQPATLFSFSIIRGTVKLKSAGVLPLRL